MKKTLKAWNGCDVVACTKKWKHYGKQGKLLTVVLSMDSRIRTFVISSGCISQFFENNVGLLEGEVFILVFFFTCFIMSSLKEVTHLYRITVVKSLFLNVLWWYGTVFWIY